MAREIRVQVTVGSMTDPKRSVTVRALVDSGSTDSALPAKILRKIGVTSDGTDLYEIWGKRIVRRRFGHAKFEIGGRSGICKVTFERRFEVPTIGATTLEDLGYDIDMKNAGLRHFTRRAPLIRRARDIAFPDPVAVGR